jgi:hypothetical protein
MCTSLSPTRRCHPLSKRFLATVTPQNLKQNLDLYQHRQKIAVRAGLDIGYGAHHQGKMLSVFYLSRLVSGTLILVGRLSGQTLSFFPNHCADFHALSHI